MAEARVVEMLRQRAQPVSGPEGSEVLSVGPADLEEVSHEASLPLRQVEILALKSGFFPERYLRNLGTVGPHGQRRLLESCVAVLGCGGLGGHVLESLARYGVGRLIVADPDCFVPHNLNRQLLCTMADVGRAKVEVARERIAQVNPAVEVRTHRMAASEDNLAALLEDAAVVVDALDNVPDRLVLEAAARRRKIPLVHGAVAGWIGQVTTVLPGDDTLSFLYGGGGATHGVETVLGTPPVTPQLVAALQVAEVIKVLLGRGNLLRGSILHVDLETGECAQFFLRGSEE